VIPLTWKHVEARSDSDFVVAPDERLGWPRTIGIGAQHVVAMFGATFLVPVLTGFPPATTLLFSGVGTHWIDVTLPPVVRGAIVALIGFNLAPAAKSNFEKGPLVGLVTLVLLVATLAFFRGIIGRLAIFLAVVAGYVLALILGDVDTAAIKAASWVGLPEFQTPTFTVAVLPMFLPAVIALVAENIGHVKSVGQMTATEVDPMIGRALAADGVATTLAGFGGGSASTTYAENIGVMAATRVLFDCGVLDRRRGGHRVVPVPQGGRGDLGDPAGRAGRRDDRAVRPGRGAGRADLADQ
jgi:xanthine/uracil permease